MLVAPLQGHDGPEGAGIRVRRCVQQGRAASSPEQRGRGLGTRLMLALAEEALAAGSSHLTLEVRVSNEAAQRLYHRFGFETVGLRRHYYRDEDALIMWALDADSADYARRLAEIREGLA